MNKCEDGMKKIHKVFDSWDATLSFMVSCEVPEGKALIVADPKWADKYHVRTSQNNALYATYDETTYRYRTKNGQTKLMQYSHPKTWPLQSPHTIYEIEESDVEVEQTICLFMSRVEYRVRMMVLHHVDGFYFQNMKVYIQLGNTVYSVIGHGFEDLVKSFEEIEENIEECVKISIDFDKKPHISCKIDKLALSRFKQEFKILIESWRIQVRKMFDGTGIGEIV